MKGLLIKDYYMILKYCRAYLLITVVFVALSFGGSDNLFLAFYPCMLSGMVPVTLLGYDERGKWDKYAGTLPYTKDQIVSAKYIIGMTTQLLVFAFTAAAQAVRMITKTGFDINEYMVLMSMIFLTSCVASSISMPFIFKLGVEKGRIAYYIMIGFVCAGSLIGSNVLSETISIPAKSAAAGACILGIAVYAISWYMSILFYRKREY